MNRSLLALACVLMWGAGAPATERKPNPRLCESQTTSQSSSGDVWYLEVKSRCHIIPLDSLAAERVQPSESAMAEWRKELWDTEQLPKRLFRYELTIVNDRGYEIDFNLSDWEVIYSPYIAVVEGFSMKVSACAQVRVSFYSPWEPVGRESPVNVGYRHEKYGWIRDGDSAFIIIPNLPNGTFIENLHAGGEQLVESLPDNGPRSAGCRGR